MTYNNKIAIFEGAEKLKYIEETIEEIKSNQVLVKIDATAICTMEQRVYLGKMKPKMPFAGGHEVAGHVIQCGGKVSSVSNGDVVALRLLTNCGHCHYCRTGNDNQCKTAFIAKFHQTVGGPGGLAKYIVVEEKNVYKVNKDVDVNYLSLTEPLACCIHSINRCDINFGDDVVIIGAGIMGVFHTMLAKLKGARVIVTEVDEERLKVAKDNGADIVINSSKVDAVQYIKDLTDGRGADVVVNTVAISKVAEDAIKMAGKLGRVVFYSSFHPDNPIDFSPNSIHYSEAIVTGSVNPSNKDFLQATRLLSSNIINPESLIAGHVSLDNLENGIAEALRPDTYRIIVDCNK